jgi:hypothetical protein
MPRSRPVGIQIIPASPPCGAGHGSRDASIPMLGANKILKRELRLPIRQGKERRVN